MKAKQKFVLLLTFFVILSTICFSGCVMTSKSSIAGNTDPLLTTITTAPISVNSQIILNSPIYSSGDIISDVTLTNAAFMIFNYNKSTDSYGIVSIKKFSENKTWGYIEDLEIEDISRKNIEEKYFLKIGHVNSDNIVANYGQSLYNTIVNEQNKNPKYAVGDIVVWRTKSFSMYALILDFTSQSDKYTYAEVHKKNDGSGWGYYSYHLNDGTLNCFNDPNSRLRTYFEKDYREKVDHVSPNGITCVDFSKL